jgi:A/G-specific adenine glycosylase
MSRSQPQTSPGLSRSKQKRRRATTLPGTAIPRAQAGFTEALLAWYDQNARALPWREDRDPYRVWLSEVMLQQTRVAAVIEHYVKFLKKFPNVKKLAQAREASVLAAWSGLGYYRRARMLHLASKAIVREHANKFPATADRLRALPGIGRYTAAAIASIAFDEPVAVVDGNVERVLSRVHGRRVEGEDLWQAAQAQLDHVAVGHARPGAFNQAVMDLGATVCTPGPPKCLVCPVAHFCATRGELAATSSKAKQQKRAITYGFSRRPGEVWLVQRGEHDSLMAGMWELPEMQNINGEHRTLLEVRHSITVTDYAVRVVELDSPKGINGKWFLESRLANLALTGLARKILRLSGLI